MIDYIVYVNMYLQVSERVREALVKRAMDFGIVFDDISITHLSFSPDFERSVERKQVYIYIYIYIRIYVVVQRRANVQCVFVMALHDDASLLMDRYRQ